MRSMTTGTRISRPRTPSTRKRIFQRLCLFIRKLKLLTNTFIANTLRLKLQLKLTQAFRLLPRQDLIKKDLGTADLLHHAVHTVLRRKTSVLTKQTLSLFLKFPAELPNFLDLRLRQLQLDLHITMIQQKNRRHAIRFGQKFHELLHVVPNGS